MYDVSINCQLVIWLMVCNAHSHVSICPFLCTTCRNFLKGIFEKSLLDCRFKMIFNIVHVMILTSHMQVNDTCCWFSDIHCSKQSSGLIKVQAASSFVAK